MTLKEALFKCQDDMWERLCDLKGFDYFVVNGGGGDIEIELTEGEALELGFLDGTYRLVKDEQP